MPEYLQLAAVFLLGMALGTVFFGGLWWTVHKVVSSKRPGLLLPGSLLLRTSLVLSGFYIIGADDSLRFGICLGGFVCARYVVTRLNRSPLPPDKTGNPEDYHAS